MSDSDSASTAAWVAVAAHAVASFALLAAGAGTVAGGDAARRAAWIGEHSGIWLATWGLWVASSLSYGVLVVFWAARVPPPHGRALAIAGATLALAGLPFDLTGEAAYLRVAMEAPVLEPALVRADGAFLRLSVFAANGLYSAGAALLSVASYRAGLFGRRLLVLGGLVAAAGFALSAAALVGSGTAQGVTGAILMALFVPFAALLALRFTRS